MLFPVILIVLLISFLYRYDELLSSKEKRQLIVHADFGGGFAHICYFFFRTFTFCRCRANREHRRFGCLLPN
jgi:hypothetical protein